MLKLQRAGGFPSEHRFLRKMVETRPFASSAVLGGLDGFLETCGVSYAGVLAAANLSFDDIDPAAHREIPLECVIAILDAAAAVTRHPCFGAEWAEAIDPRQTGVYGYLLLNAGSVREALDVTVRYLPLIVRPVAIELTNEAETATLSWRLTPGLQRRAAQYHLFAAAVTTARLRAAAGGDLDPLRVDLPCPEFPCKPTLRRLLGPCIKYDAGKTRIAIGTSCLDRRNDKADGKLFELLRNLADRTLRERAGETALAQLVRQEITARLGRSDISLEAVAAALKMMPRTLQSRLAADSTSFEAQVQEIKQSMAEHLLRDTNLSLTEIALRLGFSELSAFTRACQRWFKEPPSTLRQHLRLATERLET